MKKGIEYFSGIFITVVILLAYFGLSSNFKENQAAASVAVMSRLKIESVLSFLKSDLMQVCKDDDGSIKILSANPSSISFLHTNQSKNRIDTITYYSGPTSDLKCTPNPKDRLLYRSVNTEVPTSLNFGLVNFTIILDHQKCDVMSISKKIMSVDFLIETETAFPVKGTYNMLAFKLNPIDKR